jgi:hypothetical protein
VRTYTSGTYVPHTNPSPYRSDPPERLVQLGHVTEKTRNPKEKRNRNRRRVRRAATPSSPATAAKTANPQEDSPSRARSLPGPRRPARAEMRKRMESVDDLVEEAKTRTVCWALCIFAVSYFLTRERGLPFYHFAVPNCFPSPQP